MLLGGSALRHPNMALFREGSSRLRRFCNDIPGTRKLHSVLFKLNPSGPSISHEASHTTEHYLCIWESLPWRGCSERPSTKREPPFVLGGLSLTLICEALISAQEASRPGRPRSSPRYPPSWRAPSLWIVALTPMLRFASLVPVDISARLFMLLRCRV